MPRRRSAPRIHPPSLWERFLDLVRGRDQLLVRPPGHLPLLLITFPRGREDVAHELEAAFTQTLPLLPPPLVQRYREVLESLPVLIVIVLRPRNLCGCLGHHHPPGSESRLARRLASDLGGTQHVGEVDLAYETIRAWRPQPLARLAEPRLETALERLHFRVGLLAVLLHELEHIAFPDRVESEVRHASDEFYRMVMAELVREEGGDYGMSGASSSVSGLAGLSGSSRGRSGTGERGGAEESPSQDTQQNCQSGPGLPSVK